MGRKKKIIQDVSVIDMADRGNSIGRAPSGEIVILQSGAVPGDVIDMVVTRKKKGMKFGFVKETKSLSEDRVTPKCPNFGTCGGCKWQHLDYKKQAQYKENSVRQVIQRIAKDDGEKVGAIKAAGSIYEYRNKLEYSFSTKRWLTLDEINSEEDIPDRKGLGFHISGAFDKVLQIEECHLQEGLSNEIRNTLGALATEHEWPYYDIRKNKGLLRNVIVRNSTLGHWMITLVFGERSKLIDEVMSEMIKAFPQVTSWHYMINEKQNSSLADIPSTHVAGENNIQEQLGALKYNISPKSFFQTNSQQAKVLYDTALEMAGLQSDEIVYDLYTGTGSIALYLARDCKKVVGIEVIPEAIEDAKKNAALNDIENASFLVGDVKDVLDPQFNQIHGQPDLVITDPPRAGMHEEVVQTLLQLQPKRIVYISCNPSTQARDILLLKESYKLEKVTPVDMFPHTSHIESVALLSLK